MSIYKVPRFVLSQAPYALDLDTYRACRWLERSTLYRVDALWVRRTRGTLGVHTGYLSAYASHDSTVERFMAQYDMARFGASVQARWDGRTLWTPAPIPRADEDALIAVLDPALAHVRPLIEARAEVTVPAGWDGWYRLDERREARP